MQIVIINNASNNIGKVLYGYCNGYFGRDSYSDKVIIAEGDLWVVAMPEYGKYPDTACFDSVEEKNKRIKEWSVREEEDD
ncbi:MAG: hypothetical protein EOM67_15780 [Spirochaetia bacterium]|nr:hypothetical protein [Spirochaetia bacterium]